MQTQTKVDFMKSDFVGDFVHLLNFPLRGFIPRLYLQVSGEQIVQILLLLRDVVFIDEVQPAVPFQVWEGVRVPLIKGGEVGCPARSPNFFRKRIRV